MSQATSAPTWHVLGPSELFSELQSRPEGLTSAEAKERLARYGPNKMPEQPPPTWWEIGLRQFKSPLIYILAIAAVVSLIAHPDDPTDAIFIAAVLLINALIGGYQEWKAERGTRALQKLLHIRATLLRDEETVELDAEEVVPGDVVFLESGNRVPADIRLISAQGLEIDESLLTGESLPVTKDPAWTGDESVPLADRHNMAYAGSIVVRGRAQGVVVATGTRTSIGQLALDVLSSAGGRPPLLERMEKFTHTIGYVILAAAFFIVLVGVLFQGYNLQEMFMFGVAMAVSAIPEGLPVALTVALAIATSRMAQRGVIIRRLAAVEGLGSCTLIASDKTGTLTCNELTVREAILPDGTDITVTGEGFVPTGEIRLNGRPLAQGDNAQLDALVRAAVLCNEGDLHPRDGHWIWRGDPTDLALLSLGHKVGLSREKLVQQYPQVAAIPFEPERQFAATFHRMGESVRGMVKGAPERVLNMCSSMSGGDRDRFLHQAEVMAQRGYRVLALAEGPADHLDFDHLPETLSNLTFLGFVGMIDPLRPGAREAIAQCHDAGITVCMITGDHPVTALAIARDLGFADRPDQVITGRELEGYSPEELTEAVKRVRVFARTTPRQKLQLVEAAQRLGHYVAVTGDGVNDAPALRQANIGVAMGKAGTDVAREAAEMVITDDNFATIVAGVEEGRVAYDNVRKVIYLLISTGAAELLMLSMAVITGWPDTDAGFAVLPLLPAQLLWLNLVTNGIQDVALAFEPSEGDVLKRKPRSPREPIFNRLMIERTIVAAAIMAVIGFAAFVYMIEVMKMEESSARNALLLLLVLFQNLHIGNCRSETKSAFVLSPLRSPILMIGALTAFTVHVISMHTPFMQRILRVEPVSLEMWAVLIALAMSIVVGMELHKLWWKYRTGAWRRPA
ncbi:MAG: HAD-IC family P-type ATPase [Gemmataceae bacterium]|nr:HAD-IC family P-type ATPase [Gemmataceae bacterium]